MPSGVPVMCPGLTGWLSRPSEYSVPIGHGGPNVGPVPSETGMTNKQVLAELLARNGFSPVVTRIGVFVGPIGVSIQDAVELSQLIGYVSGHCDAHGLNSDEQSAYFALHLKPEIDRITGKWGAEYQAGAPLAETNVSDGD